MPNELSDLYSRISLKERNYLEFEKWSRPVTSEKPPRIFSKKTFSQLMRCRSLRDKVRTFTVDLRPFFFHKYAIVESFSNDGQKLFENIFEPCEGCCSSAKNTTTFKLGEAVAADHKIEMKTVSTFTPLKLWRRLKLKGNIFQSGLIAKLVIAFRNSKEGAAFYLTVIFNS